MANKDSKPVTRETIIEWISSAAKEQSGKPPTLRQCLLRLKIPQSLLYKHFNGWGEALREAGIEFEMVGERIEPKKLLADWGNVARKLGQVPVRAAYIAHGKHSPKTLLTRFGSWGNVRSAFRKFAKEKKEWADVLAICDAAPTRGLRSSPRRMRTRPSSSALSPSQFQFSAFNFPLCSSSFLPLSVHRIPDRPIYGSPLQLPGLATAPVNESGVVFLFGMLAWPLGFQVELLRPYFPDCEARRYFGHGHWQRVTIEFEYESKNFALHAHPPEDCDLIVCWEHNWLDCPKTLEVIALKDELERLQLQSLT